MSSRKVIKIFIASSAELRAEREHCVLLVNKLNVSHKHLVLNTVEWESHLVHSSYPGHHNIQEAINPLLDESDLVVFLFYSRLGEYTKAEYDYATAKHKTVFAFFKAGFTPTLESIEDYSELLKFQRTLSHSVLYEVFKDMFEFEARLYENLNLFLAEHHGITAINLDPDQPLPDINMALIKLLEVLEAKLTRLHQNNCRLSDTELIAQDQILQAYKDVILNKLLQSEEIIKQQAREKEELENQLIHQKENDALKAKALVELEKGNYPEAEAYLQESARESISDTAATFYELAKLKILQFQYKEALNFYELASKVNARNSIYLHEAGENAIKYGYDDKAIEYFKKALSINKRVYGEVHPNIATSYNNIGFAFNHKGLYCEAIENLEKALEINMTFYGDEHPKVAIHLDNLGSAYENIGQFEQAIHFYEKALKIFKRNSGTANKQIMARSDAPELLNELNTPDHADPKYYEEGLVICKLIYGREHPNIATCYNNIGVAYMNKQTSDDGVESSIKALLINQDFHGLEDHRLAHRLNILGKASEKNGNYHKAIDYFEQSLVLFEKLLPLTHPTVKAVHENLTLLRAKL